MSLLLNSTLMVHYLDRTFSLSKSNYYMRLLLNDSFAHTLSFYLIEIFSLSKVARFMSSYTNLSSQTTLCSSACYLNSSYASSTIDRRHQFSCFDNLATFGFSRSPCSKSISSLCSFSCLIYPSNFDYEIIINL